MGHNRQQAIIVASSNMDMIEIARRSIESYGLEV